jgi:glycosyltransferase involved in cell wall biosynthesis
MLVSIIIPCFNAERYVAEAIQSALDQTHTDCEVIVIDDGSTDGSLNIIQGFGDKIRWKSGPNRGGCAARNRGLQLANGEWIQFLDADDYLEPGKIKEQLSTLQQADYPDDVDVIYSPVRIEYQKDHTCVAIEQPKPPVSDDPWVLHARWELTQTGGALFRETSLQQVGAWNEQQACCQDNELFFRLLVAGKRFLLSPSAVAVYRQFTAGTVSTGEPDQVRHEILRLLDQAEEHLQNCHQLADSRANAINQHRFRLARTIWLSDAQLAYGIMRRVRHSQPDFQPEPACHAPFVYRACHNLFGFAAAEQIAALKRKLTSMAG